MASAVDVPAGRPVLSALALVMAATLASACKSEPPCPSRDSAAVVVQAIEDNAALGRDGADALYRTLRAQAAAHPAGVSGFDVLTVISSASTVVSDSMHAHGVYSSEVFKRAFVQEAVKYWLSPDAATSIYDANARAINAELVRGQLRWGNEKHRAALERTRACVR